MTCRRVSTYDDLIRAAALAYGVDPALVKAHMNVESGFNPHATNLEGSGVNPSSGLMQVRLSTARSLGYPGLQGNSDLLTGLYDPGINVPLAAKLIRENLDRAGGDVAAAISAYNGGWNVEKGFGFHLADGTFGNQRYVNDVEACYAAYANDFGGAGTPDASPPPAPVTDMTGAGPGLQLQASPYLILAMALAALLALAYYLRQRMR